MLEFQFINNWTDIQLDIVGIVAVLGEGCTSRIIQASALSWHHVLPRLLPAPQALLRSERQASLPTAQGIVMGVYSGNHKSRLNFFCQLLHDQPLKGNTVELVKVTPKEDRPDFNNQAFGARSFSPFSILALLSVIGCLFAIGFGALSLALQDGFALLATILLSCTSSIVGLASRWDLIFEESQAQPDRSKDIPQSDVVIYYPTGAFRIIRCSEEIARLYFKPDVCHPTCGDNAYRVLALLASVLLMLGLLCMSNSKPPMQIAFAGAYILLNVFYWAASALNPMKWHWEHGYDVEEIKYKEPRKHYEIKPSKNTSSKKVKFGSPTETNGIPLSPLSPNSNTTAYHVTFDDKRQPIRQRKSFRQDEQSDPQPLKEEARVNTSMLEANTQTSPRRPSLFQIVGQVSQQSINFLVPGKTQQGVERRRTNSAPRNMPDKRFTDALWTVIALTGSTRWLRGRQIVPDTEVWDKWLDIADRMARPIRTKKRKIIPAWKEEEGQIVLPVWNYDGQLRDLLKQADRITKSRPPDPTPFADLVNSVTGIAPLVKIKLKAWLEDARLRIQNEKRTGPMQHHDFGIKLRLTHRIPTRQATAEADQSGASINDAALASQNKETNPGGQA